MTQLDQVTKEAIFNVIEKKSDIDWSHIGDYALKGGLGGLVAGTAAGAFDPEKDPKQKAKNMLNKALLYGGLGATVGGGLSGAQQLTGLGYDPTPTQPKTLQDAMLQQNPTMSGTSKYAPGAGAGVGALTGAISDMSQKPAAEAAAKAFSNPESVERMNKGIIGKDMTEYNRYAQDLKGHGLSGSATAGVTHAMKDIGGTVSPADLQLLNTYFDNLKNNQAVPVSDTRLNSLLDAIDKNPTLGKTVHGLLDKMNNVDSSNPLARPIEGNIFTKIPRVLDEAAAQHTIKHGPGVVSTIGRAAGSGVVKGGVGGYLAGLTVKQLTDLFNAATAKTP